MWKYREPHPEDYESEEDYEEALAAIDRALEDYEDDYVDRRREED